MRKKILDAVELSRNDIEMPLEDLQVLVAALINKYGRESKFYLRSGYNDIEVELEFERDETDEEYGERVGKEILQAEKEEKQKSDIEHPDYELYLKLKKKFT